MPLAKQDVRAVVDVYIQAWETQNPDLITTIFTASATYHERVLEEKIRDRDGIRSYWETKVVASQANISCKPLAIYLDGDTAIVEWEIKSSVSQVQRPCPNYGQKNESEDNSARNDCLGTIDTGVVGTYTPP